MAIQDPRVQSSIRRIEKNIDKFGWSFVQAAQKLVRDNQRVIQKNARDRFQRGNPSGPNPVGDVRDGNGLLQPHQKTGDLLRSITLSPVETTKEAVIGAVFTQNSTEAYAKSVEFGSRPRVITTSKRSLGNPKVGFFGKTVNHPGTRPHPFMKPALEKAQSDFVQAAQRLRGRFK